MFETEDDRAGGCVNMAGESGIASEKMNTPLLYTNIGAGRVLLRCVPMCPSISMSFRLTVCMLVCPLTHDGYLSIHENSII